VIVSPASGTRAQPGAAPVTESMQPTARREARRGLVVALTALLLLVAFRLLCAAWDGA